MLKRTAGTTYISSHAPGGGIRRERQFQELSPVGTAANASNLLVRGEVQGLSPVGAAANASNLLVRWEVQGLSPVGAAANASK